MCKEEVRDRIREPLRDQLPKLRRLDGPQQRRPAIETQSFVRDEVEQLVLGDGPAVRRAELIEFERVLFRRENRFGIERIVSQELVRGSVKLIAARLGHHVHRRRAVAAELRGEIVRREPELLNQVDVGIDGRPARRELIVVVGSVEQEVVRAVALAVDEGGVAAGRPAEDRVARIRRRARLQLHQLKGVASVQRQLGDPLLVDEV